MWQALLAEMAGTFFFVTVILAITTSYSGNILVPLVVGLALAVGIYFTVHTSKGSLNPAVTLALYARGDLCGADAAMYMVAEFFGAMLAFLWWKCVIHHKRSD